MILQAAEARAILQAAEARTIRRAAVAMVRGTAVTVWWELEADVLKGHTTESSKEMVIRHLRILRNL